MLKPSELSPEVRARAGLTCKPRGAGRAQRSGKAFQRIIALSIANQQAVCLTELPSCGARFVGNGRIVREEIPCDFIGGIVGGPGLFFDAKCCGEDTASFPAGNKEVMKPHQVAFLKRMRAAGQVAGILVKCERLRQYLWLDAKHLDGKAIPWSDPRWVSIGHTGAYVDFSKLITEVAL